MPKWSTEIAWQRSCTQFCYRFIRMLCKFKLVHQLRTAFTGMQWYRCIALLLLRFYRVLLVRLATCLGKWKWVFLIASCFCIGLVRWVLISVFLSLCKSVQSEQLLSLSLLRSCDVQSSGIWILKVFKDIYLTTSLLLEGWWSVGKDRWNTCQC